MKQLSILFFVVIFTSILTSCGSDSSSPTSSGGSGGSTTKYQVSLSAVPDSGGSVSPTGGKYKEGKKLKITATPANSSWQFDKWSGDYQGTNSSASITVNKAKNIKANFSKKRYKLTVNTKGQGTVDQKVLETSSANGYNAGTTIELTAKPSEGWKFGNWTGDISTTDNPTQITVDKAKEVTAVFEKKSFAVTVNVEGEGSVSISPDQDEYTFGTEIELTANADQDWEFSEWGGEISETNNPLTLTVNGALTITAIFSNTTFAGGNGTESNPYKISTLEQLQAINDYPEAHYIQINDIEASETKNWNGGKGFRPIGGDIIKFRGSYNGQNYKILDMYIHRQEKEYIGLFGYIEAGEIKNINLYNLHTSGNNYTGGIAGYISSNVVVKNLEVSGSVSGSNKVGGIIGYSDSQYPITNLIANATIHGSNDVGGIIGRHESKAPIKNSMSDSKVFGESRVGGLVGQCRSNISDSHTVGKVIATFEQVGGIIGQVYDSSFPSELEFSNLHSTAVISGQEKVGGLFGTATGLISNSYFNGSIVSKNNNIPKIAGGIAGRFSYGKIKKSYSESEINGSDTVGGLVGFLNAASVVNCKVAGSVTGITKVGGIIGVNATAGIQTSYSEAKVIGHEMVGGLAGVSKYSTDQNKGYEIYKSYFTGSVSGDINVGGLVGVNQENSIIIKSYSIGLVKGNTDVGALIGTNGAKINSSYWDTEASKKNNAVGRGSADGTYGLNTSQMTGDAAKNNMSKLDFNDTWITTNSYPILFWQN